MLRPWLNEGLLLSSGMYIKIEQVTIYTNYIFDTDIRRPKNYCIYLFMFYQVQNGKTVGISSQTIFTSKH